MNILGISCYYHDSAACLLKESKLVAAAEDKNTITLEAVDLLLKWYLKL